VPRTTLRPTACTDVRDGPARGFWQNMIAKGELVSAGSGLMLPTGQLA